MPGTKTAPRKEILGFFGQDKSAAWAKVFELTETLARHRATDELSVWPELQRGEWVVVVYHGPAGLGR